MYLVLTIFLSIKTKGGFRFCRRNVEVKSPLQLNHFQRDMTRLVKSGNHP